MSIFPSDILFIKVRGMIGVKSRRHALKTNSLFRALRDPSSNVSSAYSIEFKKLSYCKVTVIKKHTWVNQNSEINVHKVIQRA